MVSSGPGRNKMSSGPGAMMKSKKVISSGPGANWRLNQQRSKGRGKAMASETPTGEKVKFTGPPCYMCGEMVIGKVLAVNDKPHHKECFTCSECMKPLRGERFTFKDGLYFCLEDYHELYAPRCYQCRGMIKSKCITIGMEDQKRHYHPEHFLCTGCGTSLLKQKLQYKLDLDGDPFCIRCFGKRTIYHDKEVHTCAICKLDIIGKYIRLGKTTYIHPEHYQCAVCHKGFRGGDARLYEGKLYCHEDYLRMLKKVCAACRKPIVGRSVVALNRTYHPEHLACHYCQQTFQDQSFWEKDNKPYCETHYYFLFGKKCAKCMQAVVVDGVTAAGKVWHKDCFLCTGCESPLKSNKIWVWEDKPFCRKCFKKLPKEVRKLVKMRVAGEQKAAKRRAKMDVQRAKEGKKGVDD